MAYVSHTCINPTSQTTVRMSSTVDYTTSLAAPRWQLHPAYLDKSKPCPLTVIESWKARLR